MTNPRPGTTTPWKSDGTAEPWSVTKDRSTMASSGNGLNRASSNVASLAVEPSAKYHRSEDADAHADRLAPAGPATLCSTTT